MSGKLKSHGGVGLQFEQTADEKAPRKRKTRRKQFLKAGSGMKADTTGRWFRPPEENTAGELKAPALTTGPEAAPQSEPHPETKLRQKPAAPGPPSPKPFRTAPAEAPPQKLYFDARAGRAGRKLRFHETPKNAVRKAASRTLRFADHATPEEGNEPDPSRETVRTTADAAKTTVYHTASGVQKIHQARKLRRAKRDAALLSQGSRFPGMSNPISKRMQKKNIQKMYAAARRWRISNIPGPNIPLSSARPMAGTATKGAKLAKKGKGIVHFVRKKAFAAIALFAAILLFPTLLLPSCGMMLSGSSGIIESTTFPPSDFDMIGAEAVYCEMEAELQARLDNYEAEHDYDEYHYELEDINHDPYVLISMLCAAYPGPWTLETVTPTLESWFAMQYTLTETVVEEVQETDPTPTEPPPTDLTEPPGPRPPRPGPGGEETQSDPTPQKQDDAEPATYRICTVTLKNFNLTHIPVYIFSQTQMETYSMYLACLGNREDLFPDSAYIGRYGAGSYLLYAIPTEALSDERFAAMMAEAEKYLGYPYVWGGSTPQTSFDCSGFVSWVINHCGVGWDIGRLGATSLYYYCTPTSTPHPGDLVFFEKTYSAPPEDICTHVGIYVGVNPENGHRMMIHCGDPISYADLSSSYWVEHLYGYGHIPDP